MKFAVQWEFYLYKELFFFGTWGPISLLKTIVGTTVLKTYAVLDEFDVAIVRTAQNVGVGI